MLTPNMFHHEQLHDTQRNLNNPKYWISKELMQQKTSKTPEKLDIAIIPI